MHTSSLGDFESSKTRENGCTEEEKEEGDVD